MFKSILILGVGGMAGSMLRHWLSVSLSGTFIPGADLFVSLVGCFILGLIVGLLIFRANVKQQILIVTVGFCGGFTTVSAFSLQSINMMMQESWAIADGYILISVISALAATFAGISLAK